MTVSFPSTGLYDPKAFITHAASLRQAFAHCAISPTAASRRSLGRVSVPVWLDILSRFSQGAFMPDLNNRLRALYAQ